MLNTLFYAYFFLEKIWYIQNKNRPSQCNTTLLHQNTKQNGVLTNNEGQIQRQETI